MFDWFRKKKKKAEETAEIITEAEIPVEDETAEEDETSGAEPVPAAETKEDAPAPPAETIEEDGEPVPTEDEPADEPLAAEPEPPFEEEEIPSASASDETGQAAEVLSDDAAVDEAMADEEAESDDDEDEPAESKKGIFARFRDRLSSTRNRIAGRIETLLSSVRTIDDDVLDELEELLITSDMGARTTGDLLFKIRGQVASRELSDVEALKAALKSRIREMVDLPRPKPPKAKPLVLMVVGINGVGKTTTIAKLTKRFIDEGQKVLLAAGDTFRSAAVDQLAIWAERLGADIVSQPTGADAAAVVFDALNAAQARQADVVIIDTAGRLHTKVNLMDELKKIKRVAGKALPGAPHHTILVLDGNTGQNALSQAKTFHEAIGVDSIIITKLDGTAKGGVIVSIANELKIPIVFVGLGETFEDLQPFDAEAFTEAIVSG